MAPPTSLPRLAAIVPEQLARETVERVLAHVGGYSVPLSPGVDLDLDTRGGGAASTGLYHSILDLCAWAQRGEGIGEETMDLCLSVGQAVYPEPLDGREGDGTPDDLRSDADPTTEIGLLIVAAFARERLARGEAVSPRELGALAGVTDQHVRLLIREGELAGTTEDGAVRVAARAARRWLAGRGVPGFEGRR